MGDEGEHDVTAHEHDHDAEEKGLALRVKALEELLVEQGLVDPAALDRIVEAYETRIGPRNGARVVARAWVNPAYKARLLENATAAIVTSTLAKTSEYVRRTSVARSVPVRTTATSIGR